ncbi:WXG100 family type VII secretion target [Streptomyces sp. WAC01280]|uniref:WXG100 family type VII secretion target n=1 Tax=Streptomyces sp. WAC01280 TaxID=2487424 RepID=UPI000F7A7FCC|nr:WXG100 family type VII secretion target [Streptomyces sp. WAC01280]RSS56757.1 WXG100 family type VII secretion target [Streptomyces sp. WAC01280]
MGETSGGSITVDLAALGEIAGELEDILRRLNEGLEELYDRVEPVVLGWQGVARDTFVGELDRWDREMRDLQAAQTWLHSLVTTGQANYGAAQRAVLNGWGGA